MPSLRCQHNTEPLRDYYKPEYYPSIFNGPRDSFTYLPLKTLNLRYVIYFLFTKAVISE